MKRNIQMLLAAALAVLTAASCSQKKFHVEGTITEAADSVLYFENIGLEGIEVVDSVMLKADGAFQFSATQTPAPEFYRLRISNQIISLSVDSTETITVKAAYPTMAAQYDVSGSDNCQKIKELTLKQQQLTRQAIDVQRNPTLSIDAVNDSIQQLINRYKEEVKNNYIFREPFKAYAYFALFQTLGPWLIFNPQANTDDIKVFAAVATSWDTYYPNAERGKNLHNIALEGMKNQRIVAANQSKAIDAGKVSTAGVIDIALQDNHGQTRRLTDLAGKVVLLDFHAFSLDESPQRILLLRELYNKYHAQGLEIYQVSLDGDEHFWKQQTQQLPWISVRDEDGVNSQNLLLYNVQAIPDFFLIDRGNNLVGRASQLSDIDAAIRKLL